MEIYFTLLDSILFYHGSTLLYLILHHCIIALLHSHWPYITLPWLYFTLLDSALLCHGSTSLYLTLHHSIVALLHSTWLYVTLPWLAMTMLGETFTPPSTSHLVLFAISRYQMELFVEWDVWERSASAANCAKSEWVILCLLLMCRW